MLGDFRKDKDIFIKVFGDILEGIGDDMLPSFEESLHHQGSQRKVKLI